MLSFLEISKTNLIHNFLAFRSLLPASIKMAAVVKGNSYGHGQKQITEILEPYADYFQLDDLEELRLLRKTSQKPALILGYVLTDELEEAAALDSILAIYDTARLPILNEIAKKLGKKQKIHVKIDAELGRQGVLPAELPEFLNELKKSTHLDLDGVYSHFANIEDTSDFSHAQKQIDSFKSAVAQFEKAGFTGFKKHLSSSSGVLAYEKNAQKNDLVRTGIGLYGLWPSEDLKKAHPLFELKPVLRWVSHIAQVKTLPTGHSIGYGLTHITTKPTKIAVIPQGYSDGYDRGLSSKGEVLIQGKRCPILGRVSMNMFTVDVSHLDSVKPEEEVVLLGEQGAGRITAEEIGEKIGTINYEVVTRISPLLPRIIS